MHIYEGLTDKEEYALPYLIIPNPQYINSDLRILVIGKETNGWGCREKSSWEPCDYKEKLIHLHDDKVNLNLGAGLGSRYWDFVQKLKNCCAKFNLERLKDSSNSYSIGLISGNTALIGYRYGVKGFNPELIRNGESNGLEKAFSLLYESLKPQMMIFTIGSNLNNGYVKNYLQIFSKTLKCDQDPISSINITTEQTNNKIIVHEMISNLKDAPKIFITNHPERIKHEQLLIFFEQKNNSVNTQSLTYLF